MIVITEGKEGCILPVRAQPGARKNAVVGEHGGALKLAVTAPPEDGRANKAIVELLSSAFAIRRAQIELASGAAGRDKRFVIRGIEKAELERLVAALLEK